MPQRHRIVFFTDQKDTFITSIGTCLLRNDRPVEQMADCSAHSGWARRMQHLPYVGRLLLALLAFRHIQPTHSVACGRPRTFSIGTQNSCRDAYHAAATPSTHFRSTTLLHFVIVLDTDCEVTPTQSSAHDNYVAFIDFNC